MVTEKVGEKEFHVEKERRFCETEDHLNNSDLKSSVKPATPIQLHHSKSNGQIVGF